MAYIDQLNNNPTERAKMDSEYSALMAELGVGAASQFLNSGKCRRLFLCTAEFIPGSYLRILLRFLETVGMYKCMNQC